MKNLEKLCVQEMNAVEMRNENGGFVALAFGILAIASVTYALYKEYVE